MTFSPGGNWWFLDLVVLGGGRPDPLMAQVLAQSSKENKFKWSRTRPLAAKKNLDLGRFVWTAIMEALKPTGSNSKKT